MNIEDIYKVKVESIFEGPMDLLVFLCKKNEVDIYDIPIAMITDQYLEYLEWMKSMNIDFAGDFIVLAATLTQIKSKMLLPVHDMEADEEDPRLEIIRPITEYLRMKDVAERLAERDILGEDTFAREPLKEEIDIQGEEEIVNVGLYELIDAFKRILDNMPDAHRVDLSDEGISIKDKITELVQILEEKGSVVFESLFSADTKKIEIIVTFLAILEMAKLNLVRITQNTETGNIRLFYI